MKRFEIGSGLIAITVSDEYLGYWEEDDIFVLHYPPNEDLVVRITVFSVVSETNDSPNPMFEETVTDAKKGGHQVKFAEDKSYFSYEEDSLDGEEKIRIFFYQIGFKNHCIILSLTGTLKDIIAKKHSKVLFELEEFIPSIEEIPKEGMNFFEPTYEDNEELSLSISEVLDVKENEILKLHEKDKTLPLLQKILNARKDSEKDSMPLRSLGFAFGDYFRSKIADFRWVLVRDEFGREPGLRFKQSSFVIFPGNMILKRVEEGETVDLKELFEQLIAILEEFLDSGDIT